MRQQMVELHLNPEPQWILGIPTGEQSTSEPAHISGQLREIADIMWEFEEMQGICILIEEAAEKLDDAHQEWMERQLNAYRQAELIRLLEQDIDGYHKDR
jgi:hypothetical protein